MPKKGQVSHGKKILSLKQKCPCELCEKYREKIRAQKRASRLKCGEPDRSEYRKKYYEKNREYYKNYYEENRERYLASFKNTYQKDKEGSRLKKQKRRALKTKSLGEWPDGARAHVASLHILQEGLCYYCGLPYKENRNIEHKTPLVRGGLHDYRNVVLSCAACNLEKGNKTEKEYQEFLDNKISA